MQHKNVTAQLEELGLSEHEAAIYLVALEQGEVSAGVILDQVKLHREQVYRALKRLVDGGLLTTYTKRKRGYYAAVDPDVLVKRQEQKTSVAKSLQPYLNELRQNRPQTIRITEGADAIERLLEDISTSLPKGGEYLVLGGVGELFYQYTKDVLPKYSRVFAKKGITPRITAFSDQDYSLEQEYIGSNVRYLPQSMSGPTATVIYGNKVAIEVFDPNNLAVITIENEFLANSYRQTFETIWEHGAEVQGSTLAY